MNTTRTTNNALANGLWVLEQQNRRRKGTIMHKAIVWSLVFLLVFACFEVGI